MLTRKMLVWLVCVTGGIIPSTNAADLTKVERSITKEPVYKTKTPLYCLLVFGPEANYRVWLVLDGDTLYVDRNGNGDLTEAGEYTQPENTNTDPASFKPVFLFGPDGKSNEELHFCLYGWFDYKQGKKSDRFSPSVSVQWKGRWFGCWGDETGPCVWAARPQDAPILHIDGPLQMGFEQPAEYSLRCAGKDEFELSVGVGTKGIGKGGFVHLCYVKGAIPDKVYPSAVLEFPNKMPSGPAIRVEALLKERC